MSYFLHRLLSIFKASDSEMYWFFLRNRDVVEYDEKDSI